MAIEKKEVISPKSVKQWKFINSDADIVVFGGAAGSGKTFLGIMDFLKHIKHPNFRGLITRRTTPQLQGAGGVIDTAMQLFKKVDNGVKYKAQKNKFVFSSGAEVHLRHFESLNSKDNFQGLQANEILVDEGQQYIEEMVLYLMSRMRNPACPQVIPKMRITCNPLKDCYLHKWIEWYLDEDGYPIPERDGVIRYFIRKDDTMIWGNTKQELIDEYLTPTFNPTPLSFQFISATVRDNPVLMEVNPEYVGWLEGLKDVERARLLLGCWNAAEKSASYWRPEWCEVVPLQPIKVVKRVRAWDIAGTLKSDINPDPDYTAGVLMSRDKNGVSYVEDVVRFRANFGEVYEKILAVAKEDGDDVIIAIPQDAGAAGKAYASSIIRDLSNEGFYAKAKAANQSKVIRFAPFCSASESGSVKLVKGDWNEAFIKELSEFDGIRSRKRHDDQVDSCGDSFMLLASHITIPTFSIPDMTTTNSFKF